MVNQLATLEAAIAAFPELEESSVYDWNLSRAFWDLLLSIQNDGRIYNHGATIHDLKRLAAVADCENVINWQDQAMVDRLITWVKDGAFQ
jgi:hypothetical protein